MRKSGFKSKCFEAVAVAVAVAVAGDFPDFGENRKKSTLLGLWTWRVHAMYVRKAARC